jgi:hypothetical protein
MSNNVTSSPIKGGSNGNALGGD